MRDPSGENEKRPAATPAVDAKGKTPAQETPADEEIDTPLPFTQESEVLIPGKFSDDREKLMPLSKIQADLEEQTFYIQKSNLSIFRYEDVIFNVFPHLAALKRRGATTKEIFQTNDPFSKSGPSNNPIDQPIQMQGNNQYENSEMAASRTMNASREMNQKMTIEQASSASFGQNESSK